MLHPNNIFTLQDIQYRLLKIYADVDKAWVIQLGSTSTYPLTMPWSAICELEAESSSEDDVEEFEPTQAQLIARNIAWARLENLVRQTPHIFIPEYRWGLIQAHAAAVECSERTLYKDLRRYWQGGQVKQALLPHFQKKGRSGTGLSANRGRTRRDGTSTYQLQSEDLVYFKQIIESHYLADERTTVVSTFNRLLQKRYLFTDGNGKKALLCREDRPTLRQFRYFLKQNYSLQQTLKTRIGEKEFARNKRAVVGTVKQDCLGVGHFYEIDATIADVFLVSSTTVQNIIGKPTMYLIVDRESRLITGFYVGLEHACWAGAVEAITSISNDKRELCERLNVEYRPEDWPAHELFPKEFLADRGEGISKASREISDSLNLCITNVPGLRPDWKALVENKFKLIHEEIKDGLPAYDPPSNATKRRNKKYDKEACLTLQDFSALIVEAIIAHNNKPMPNYPLSREQLDTGLLPTPINLWNYGVQYRAGLATHFTSQVARKALLPTGRAVVSEKGVFFKGCYYSCAELESTDVLVHARSKRMEVEIKYDSCLVDRIYILGVKKGRTLEATLTPRSFDYKGLSFSEVHYYESMKRDNGALIDQIRLEVKAKYHLNSDGIVDRAKKRLKDEGTGKSRSARRADTKAARSEELTSERQLRGGPVTSLEQPTTNVHSITGAGTSPQPLVQQPTVNSTANRLQQMRNSKKHGT